MNFASKLSIAIVVVGILTVTFFSASTRADQIAQQLKLPTESHAPQALTVATDTVEWTASNGDDVTHVRPDTTAVFYINDDALETTKAGVATFLGHGATARFFNVPGGAAGTESGTATSTGITRALSASASDYSITTPALTPWTGAPPVVTAGSSVVGVASYNPSAGTVTLLADTGTGDTTVSFTYHLVDVWGTSTSATRRAKVVSTSDSQGEFVLITEVASVGSEAEDPDSRIFRGAILLSSNAATQGTNSDGVWVQDGDTLTVTYLKSDGTALDSDTITVDAVKPSVAAITPADDTITGTKNPSVSFEVTDAGAGFASNLSTAITLAIFAGGSTTTIASTVTSYQPIADGFRVIFTQMNSWLGAYPGFGASDGTAFEWILTATDKAGNSKSITNDLTIDITKPTVNSAITGIGYDTSLQKETTGQRNSVKLSFSEEIDASSVSASDFTVGGVTPSAAVVGTKDPHKDSVYLTDATLAPDAKPEVKVIGGVTDKAGNVVDVSSSVTTNRATASDGIKPGIQTTISTTLAVKNDKVKVTVTSDEKLGTTGMIVSIHGPFGSSVNRLLTTAAPTNPLVREGEITVPAGLGVTGMYGVSIQATDLGTNSSNNLTKVTTEVIPVSSITIAAGGATAVIKLGKGPIGDNNFDGDLTRADIGSLIFSSAGERQGNILFVDASARTITITNASGTPIVATETAVATYWYTKTEFIEIDNSAPAIVDTLLFDPSDGACTINRTPFISVKWDEDEYPGDSKTTVTLTKASLKSPDGTETDILSLMSTTDSKTYFYRPIENMAIGEYTLTVSAKDIAGNEKKDVAAKIEINDDAPTIEILRPSDQLESSSPATITVKLNCASGAGVTVSFATSNGTATAGSDYTANNGTLTWSADESGNKTFSVVITDDALEEDGETVTLTLSNATTSSSLAVSIATGTATLLILDDEPVAAIVTMMADGEVMPGDSYFLIVAGPNSPALNLSGLTSAQLTSPMNQTLIPIANVSEVVRKMLGLDMLRTKAVTHAWYAMAATSTGQQNIQHNVTLNYGSSVHNVSATLNVVTARTNRNIWIQDGVNFAGLALVPNDTSIANLLMQPVWNANPALGGALSRQVTLADVIQSIFAFSFTNSAFFSSYNTADPISGVDAADTLTQLAPFQGMIIKSRDSVTPNNASSIDVFETVNVNGASTTVPIKINLQGPYLVTSGNSPLAPVTQQLRIGYNLIAPHVSAPTPFEVAFSGHGSGSFGSVYSTALSFQKAVFPMSMPSMVGASVVAQFVFATADEGSTAMIDPVLSYWLRVAGTTQPTVSASGPNSGGHP